MVFKKKNVLIILLVVVSILLIPLIAMQFTKEVDWGILDFLVMGGLLFIVGVLADLILRRINKSKYKITLLLSLLILFLLIWTELAVGIFGTPFAGD